ncbi:MAG: hypothetical protein R3F65_14430 [bacterium]
MSGRQNGLDPPIRGMRLLDVDLDGLDAVQEFAAGTSPVVVMPLMGRLLDGDEVARGRMRGGRI